MQRIWGDEEEISAGGLAVSCVSSILRSLCLPLSPRQGQPMYSIPPGGFRHPYPALAMNASMSRWADHVQQHTHFPKRETPNIRFYGDML